MSITTEGGSPTPTRADSGEEPDKACPHPHPPFSLAIFGIILIQEKNTKTFLFGAIIHGITPPNFRIVGLSPPFPKFLDPPLPHFFDKYQRVFVDICQQILGNSHKTTGQRNSCMICDGTASVALGSWIGHVIMYILHIVLFSFPSTCTPFPSSLSKTCLHFNSLSSKHNNCFPAKFSQTVSAYTLSF